MRALISTLMLFVGAAAARAEGGSVSGTIGGEVRRGAVWLEGVPAGSWTLPKESLSLSQHGARFQPDLLVITVGQTVVMPNDDRIIHNVFSVSPPRKFDLGHYPQGDTRSVRFDKPGVVDLFCNIHDSMHATIVVAPSPFHALTGPDGKFTIANVPPGTYRAVAWSPEGSREQTTITVTAGANATVTFTVRKQ